VIVMRTRPLICAAVGGAALIAPPPSIAQSTVPTPLSGVEVVVKKPEPTPLSGVDVVVRKKAEPTPLSGVDVVVHRATPVSEVDVVLPPCPKANGAPDSEIPTPKVVSTFPAKGAVVRPGLLVVRVTFDRPMTCVGVLQNHIPLPDPCPPPLREPMISRDKRTFLTVCMVEANRHYGLWLKDFTSLGGRSPPSYEMVFDTSDKADITRVEEAVAEDEWLRRATVAGS
jgi:hypothetical protein